MRAVSLHCGQGCLLFPSADRSYGSLPTLGIRSPLMLFLNVHIATKLTLSFCCHLRGSLSWKPPTFCVRCSSMNLHLCLSAHWAPIGDHERFPLCMRLLQIPHRIMFRWGISFFFLIFADVSIANKDKRPNNIKILVSCTHGVDIDICVIQKE